MFEVIVKNVKEEKEKKERWKGGPALGITLGYVRPDVI